MAEERCCQSIVRGLEDRNDVKGDPGGFTSSLDRASKAFPSNPSSRSVRAARNLPIGFQTILTQAIAFVLTP